MSEKYNPKYPARPWVYPLALIIITVILYAWMGFEIWLGTGKWDGPFLAALLMTMMLVLIYTLVGDFWGTEGKKNHDEYMQRWFPDDEKKDKDKQLHSCLSLDMDAREPSRKKLKTFAQKNWGRRRNK